MSGMSSLAGTARLATRFSTARSAKKVPRYTISNAQDYTYPAREAFVLATTGIAISCYGLFQGHVNRKAREAARAAETTELQ